VPKKNQQAAATSVSVATERYLTLREAGEFCRAPPETVRYWIWQGKLRAYRPGRQVLVRESELIAYIESREVTTVRAAKC
jgi:excisionase family DNA binding protein